MMQSLQFLKGIKHLFMQFQKEKLEFSSVCKTSPGKHVIKHGLIVSNVSWDFRGEAHIKTAVLEPISIDSHVKRSS